MTERITVYAGGNQIKRGIFRDFPSLYRGSFGTKKKVGFEVVGVRKNGKPENYVLEGISGGNRVRIGNASVFLDGRQPRSGLGNGRALCRVPVLQPKTAVGKVQQFHSIASFVDEQEQTTVAGVGLKLFANDCGQATGVT